MKHGLLTILFISLAALLAAQSPAQPPAIAVSGCAVTGFEPVAAYESFVIDAFAAELARFPAVRTLDRRSLDAQLREIELSLSGLVDSNSAVEAGGIIGAGWILTASLTNFGGSSAVLSAQLISTASGEVGYAASEIIDGVALPPIQERVRAVARAVVARLQPGAAPTIESLWVTRAAPASTAPGTPAVPAAKPILIWVMSDTADAADPNGVWYLGTAQLKPLTDRLRDAGHGVVAHDRRTLARLDQATLADYSQVWIVEGDGDATVDVSAAERAALRAYYEAGGRVWLSGENALEPAASWIEDVNAFASLFGAQLGGIVILREPGLTTRGLAGPLFRGVERLVYDDEISVISFSQPGFSVLLEAPADARLATPPWTSQTVGRYALRERVQQLATSPNYTYGWLFGANFNSIGRALGRGQAVLALRDERLGGKGMVLIDSGWLIGWTFNGPLDRITDVGQNVTFLLNVANYLAGR